MTTIWLTRHAESATPTVFHGAESDVGLSDRGRRQALAAAPWFAQLAPTVVVSSAMRRAIDTAQPIAAACGIPHELEPSLHERRVGILSGTGFASGTGPWHDTVEEWMAGNTRYTTPGAESFDDLRLRLVPAIEGVAARFSGGRIVVVAHGVVCKTLLVSLLPEYGPKDWRKLGLVGNLAVSELTLEQGTWGISRLLETPRPVAELADSSPPIPGERSQA